MGCCKSKAAEGAYRHALDTPLLPEVAQTLGSDAFVLVVRLAGLREIPMMSSFTCGTDAYVEFKLTNHGPSVGPQTQFSSIRPNTIFPTWQPPERFQFIIPNPATSRIVVSVYHYNAINPKDSVALADGVLKVSEFTSISTLHDKFIKLVSPSNGKPAGEAIVHLTKLSLQEASGTEEHTCYEFQRWRPLSKWGEEGDPNDNLLPTDPGRWSDEGGKKFDDALEKVAPKLLPGWEVATPWHTVSSDEDPEGWEYALNFDSPYWFKETGNSSYVVRRRSWHRVVKRSVTMAESSTESSVASKQPRRKKLF